jgi:hypothetical protein
MKYGTLALLPVTKCITTNSEIMQVYEQQINIKDNAVMLSPKEMQANYARSQRHAG